MYCYNCGQKIDDNAEICINCGVRVNKIRKNTEYNVFAIIGFFLSFFMVITSLIISIIGYKKSKALDGQYKWFAIAGIIISSVKLAIILFYIFIYVLVALIFLNAGVV